MRFNFTASSHWAFICGTSVGVLIAFPLAAPLFDGKILEPVATLWGNALGAVGAVAAAVWAGDRAAHQQQRQGAALIVTFVAPLAQQVSEVTAFYSRVSPADDSDAQPSHTPDEATATEICTRGHLVRAEHRRFQQLIHRVEALLNYLGPTEMQVFLELEEELATMDNVIGGLIHHGSTAQHQQLGHTPSTGLRTRLAATNRRIQSHLAYLKNAAR